jgi:hypothetical protein
MKQKSISPFNHSTCGRPLDIAEVTSNRNLLSVRVSDNEKELFEMLAKSSSITVSELMRDAMDLWLSRRNKLSPTFP